MSSDFKKNQFSSKWSRASKLLLMAGKLGGKEIAQKLKLSSMNETRMQQALELVKNLGELKGAAMKMGQLLALEARDYLPDEICQVLEQLQNQASFLDFKQIDQILKIELKNKYDDLLNIQQTPLAAASIGQVHKAEFRKKNSTEIQTCVLKIQYPGIRDSIDSDIEILIKLLESLTFILGKETDLRDLTTEFSAIFKQESDYLKEAEFTYEYQNLSKNISNIVVPHIYKEYSTNKVLCLEYQRGVTIPNWIRSKSASHEDRIFYAHLILNLYIHEFCKWGLVQTDPNLGNFLLRPENRELILLDFGACKKYDLKFRKLYAHLVFAVLENNPNKMDQISQEMNLIDERESKEAKKIFRDLLTHSMLPLSVEEYDFSNVEMNNQYAQEIQSLSKSLAMSLKYSPPPKDLIFLHRKLNGIFQILRILKVPVKLQSYTKAFEELLDTSN